MHAGYLRHYGEPLRRLAEQGHAIHLALGQPDKEPVDGLLVDRLRGAGPHVTVSYGPERSYIDGWRRIAWLVRGLTDLARYADPRYAQATALRARMHSKVVDRVRGSAMEPLSKHWVARFADRVANASGLDEARRYGRLLARYERAIPPSRRHVKLLRSFRPDAVLVQPGGRGRVAPGRVPEERAGASAIPTGVCVASWDNLTNKGLLRVVPDRVFVWNEVQVREAVELHGVAADRVVATGAQKFDEWFERRPSTTARTSSRRRSGSSPGEPFVLYLVLVAVHRSGRGRASSSAGSRRCARRPAGARGAGVVVRPHPTERAQWHDVDAACDGVAVWPPAGAQPRRPAMPGPTSSTRSRTRGGRRASTRAR